VTEPLSGRIVIRIADLTFPLDSADAYGIRPAELSAAVNRKLGLPVSFSSSPRVLRISVDARKKSDIRLVCMVSCQLTSNPVDSSRIARIPGVSVEALTVDCTDADPSSLQLMPRLPPDRYGRVHRPIVVGMGPAGLFAALLLARAGLSPIVVERGPDIGERTRKVAMQWKTGETEADCNVQFGEGGAGAFSDGKLTTRIHDARCAAVLAEFVAAGAPPEILYRAKPHIGTDRLESVVANLRESILQSGGSVRFHTRFESPVFQNGHLAGAVLRDLQSNETETISTDALVLAPGHSARDTFESLALLGVAMEAKPFSIGARIEHPQQLIDRVQFGSAAGHPALGHAEYQFNESTGGRTVYTFCMCPGGIVVASASEPGTIVVNGMSRFGRDAANANSALVVSVTPQDFDGVDALAGVRFQRTWEKAAFRAGRGGAPIQRVGRLLGRMDTGHAVEPSYTGPVHETELSECLPGFVIEGMKAGILAFERKLPGFAMSGALLTGVETRTSSPLRILRDDSCQSVSHPGLHPCGEGAGYAGGIMSAAVDGIRVAEAILSRSEVPVTVRSGIIVGESTTPPSGG
jgi:uncharacterized FAD-dependent dehydrogenase